MKSVTDVLSEMIYFCIETNEEHIDPLEAEGVPIKARQRILREQKVIEIVLEMVTTPFVEFGGKTCSLSELHSFSKLEYICNLGYKLLYHFFKGYKLNQLYLARWFTLLQSSVQIRIN